MDLNEEFKKALQEGYRYGEITMDSSGGIYIDFSTGFNGRGKYKLIETKINYENSI